MQNRNLVDVYIDKINDFSSQYGSDRSRNYKIQKLIGKPTVYPNYGDNNDTAAFRHYGNNLNKCAYNLPIIESNKLSTYTSEDFFEFSIALPLYIQQIQIFETYNPGSIEKIFVFVDSWVKMWEKSKADKENINHSRAFSPNLPKINWPCKLFRVEVNQSRNEYYSQYDAIKVTGCRFIDTIPYVIEQSANSENNKSDIIEHEDFKENKLAIYYPSNNSNENFYKQEGKDYISHLPEEILIKIFSYFPLKTLSKIACVSKRFNASVIQAMEDIQILNLKSVWNKLDHNSLMWLSKRCPKLSRVDMSWVGKHTKFSLYSSCNFFTISCIQLTSLRLSACKFVNDTVMRCISNNCIQLKELDLSSCTNISSTCFLTLKNLKLLKYINLYRTLINDETLVQLLPNWIQLMHLNLGSCDNLRNWKDIIDQLTKNCRNLRSLDAWRSKIENFDLMCLSTSCTNLEELDLGWCRHIISSSNNNVDTLISMVSRNLPELRKLCLTANRTISDLDLESLANNCTKLQSLDVLGARGVTSKGAHMVISKCHDLKILDLSYCHRVDKKSIDKWRKDFPNCVVLRCYQDQLCT